MITHRTVLQLAVAAAALGLSACGGGGGSGPISTPAPTPSPAPTPTPTPTPTPPPTGANANLVDPQVSETYRNVAARGTLSVPTSGANVTATATSATPTFVYSAANQSYTITDGALSATFLPANIDPSQSDPTVTTYKVTSGTTTEYLTLTKPGTGAGQTRYVAAGFWQRQTNGTATTDGRFYGFSYGAATPDAGLPRSGAASFDVKFLGARTLSADVYSLSGSGTMLLDFLSGGMFGSGFYNERNASTGIAGGAGLGWRNKGLISTASNAFSGDFTLDSIGTGPMQGSFYGPAAQEIGGAFAISPNSEQAAVGAFYGTRGTTPVNTGTSLGVPGSAMFFKPLSSSLRATSNAAGTLVSVASAPGLASIYQTANSASGIPLLFYSADGRIGQPFPGPTTFSYQLYGTNLGFMRAALQLDQRSGNTLFDSAVFGFDTPSSAVPRTGSGTYSVQLSGGVAENGAKLLTLNGNGSVTANFGTGAVATLGTYSVLSATPIVQGGGTSLDSGSWNGTGTISASANSYAGSLTLTGGKTYTGNLNGKFFGAAAEETGATFLATAANGAIASGALFGGRGADQTASQVGLANLTATTSLLGKAAMYSYTPSLSPPHSNLTDPNISITYDPAAKSYVFKSTTTGMNLRGLEIDQTLTQADAIAAGTDASFTAYRAGTTDARIYKFGPGNPQLVLTYSSFAEITKPTSNAGNAATTTYYIPFGGVTPSFQMPTTGTATYSGIVFGRGGDGPFVGDTRLSGTSLLTANFGTGNIDMMLNLLATDTSGVGRSLGSIPYILAGGCPGSCPAILNSVNLSAAGTAFASGGLNGHFYGLNAAEFGASFNLLLVGGSASGSSFSGVTVGKRD